jgi:hypothetical protein
MGVRVYAASAESQLGSLTNPVKQASLQLTTGEGSQTVYPLAILTVDISQSDNQNSRNSYCSFLKGSSCSP